MNTRLHIYLVTLVLAMHSFQLMGQHQVSYANTTEWKAEIVDLPGSGFEEIVQDSSGFMWIGTEDGLIQYDGINIKTHVHEPDNPNSISSDEISELFLQDKRYLWIGCYGRGGLNRMDLLSGAVNHYLEKVTIREIIADTRGNIWAGSDEGVYRLDPGTLLAKHYRTPLKDSISMSIKTIIEDSHGII